MSTANLMSENQINLCEIVEKARQLLTKLPPPINASDTTKIEYRRELQRLISKSQGKSPDNIWAAICATHCKKTYYRRIAAVRYGLRRLIEDALDQEKVDVLHYLTELHKLLKQHEGTCPIEAPLSRHSKRQDLQGLPADWRELMYCGMAESKYRLPFLVMALTGCRPEELQQGVSASMSAERLTFKIIGAKVKETQGQPFREIEYAINDHHPLIEALLTDEYFQPGIIKVLKKENYTSAVRRVGRKLWPRKKAEITPYCLRHAAASDFKDCLSADDVSKAIGHAIDATKSLYGQRQMSGAGGLKPVAVNATREIKHTAKTGVHFSKRTSSRP